MSLETTITNAWHNKARWLYFLLPFSWLYRLVISLRKFLYKKQIISSYRATIPVMIVGNISVGGSGKTPLIISLVSYLRTKGIKVGVISRGYGGDSTQMPAIVTAQSTPSLVGDEPCLIVQSTAVAMAVCPNRQQAIELLIQTYDDLDIIISDDGLQHYKLQRDIEWIVVDSQRGFGNQQLLPVGFLREPMSRLDDGATVIYHQCSDANKTHNNNDHELTMTLQAEKLQSVHSLLKFDPVIPCDNFTINHYRSVPVQSYPQQGDTLYAVSGIGYPQRFFNSLRQLGYAVIEHPYSDHYDFNLNDIEYIGTDSGDRAIVITSKDAVKIIQIISEHIHAMAEYDQVMPLLDNLLTRLFILPVTADLSPACHAELDTALKKLAIV